MSTKHQQVAELLIDLECALRRLDLWSEERPSAEALGSEQPFCVDTLAFEEWLQFVFIERMTTLVEEQAPLPERCGLTPMAEEYFRGARYSPDQLFEPLARIDRLLSR